METTEKIIESYVRSLGNKSEYQVPRPVRDRSRFDQFSHQPVIGVVGEVLVQGGVERSPTSLRGQFWVAK